MKSRIAAGRTGKGRSYLSSEQTLPEIDWVVSSSPHVKAKESTSRIMWSVNASLMPAAAWAVYQFGWHAAYVIAMCVFTCVVTEYVCNRMRSRPATIADGSAILTGLLLAFILPSSLVIEVRPAPGVVVQSLALLPWYIPVVGSIVAIGIAKHCFGGLGHNIWNPALVGRAFCQISFGSMITMPFWPFPRAVDGVTAATSLSKTATTNYSVAELFIGNCSGSLGEVSALLLLVGVAYLVFKKYVNWRLPLAYIGALVVCCLVFALLRKTGMASWANDYAESFAGLREGAVTAEVFAHSVSGFIARVMFSGGVMLGALYMATDMVTSPLTNRGQLIYGLGCGILTALIRVFGNMPEGVCYAILIMNTVRPYIDRISRQKILGEAKPNA
jgi:H+/Na+-translocating ferredoxin:NAD+ oxidoreductase subunit D